MKEAKIFESWIDRLAEGTWNLPETPEQLDKLKTMMAAELIVGPDAINATEQLYDLVGDDILFDRLSELAAKDPRANAWNDTEVMNRLAELGIEMPEPSVPGNPAEPATAPVPPVAAAPAAPAVPAAPVAEGKWDPFTGGDYGQTPRPQQVGQDTQDSDAAAPDKKKDQEEWEAMLDYYGTNALVARALGDLYQQTHGTGYYDSVLTPVRYIATISSRPTPKSPERIETISVGSKKEAHERAKGRLNGRVVSIERVDDKEDEAGLITLPVLLGLGQQKKKWMLQFPDERYAQKWAFTHKNVATILWPEGHNLEKDVTEGMGSGVDAKGRTQAQWIQMVKAKFPDGKMIQAKMPDGPVQVTLPDGRKLGWKKVEQAVAEGQDATTYTVAYKDPNKPGKSYSTQVKATSAAEAKAAFQEWDDTGRFTYLGSRPDVDTVYEEQGVAEVQLVPQWQDDPEHLAYRKRQADISRSTGLAVGDRVTLKDRPGFEGEIVHDWGGGDFTISGSGGGMSQSKNHRANARLIQKIQGVAEGEDSKEIGPGWKTEHGIVDSVEGNSVIVKTSKGKMIVNMHDIKTAQAPEQGMTESTELNTMLKYAGIPVAESRVLDEAGETIDHILNRFKHEVKQFEQGHDLDSDLYEALFDYYSDAGEMPYGVAKARTGDPMVWVSDKLADHLGVNEGWKGAIAGGLAGGALGSVVPALGSLAGAAVGAYAGHKLGDEGFKDPDAAYKQAQKLKLKQTPPVAEADPISTFEVMSGFDAPVAEGSCNMTAEGAYCPEHGLAECGGGMYESREGDAMLARIKSLALLK